MKAEKPRPIPLAEKIKDLRGIDSRKATRTFEWCCEWASYWLSRWAFLEVLEYVGKLGILLAVVAYLYPGCEERKQATEDAKQAAADARKSRHYVAWQTINSALGKPGNGGRADALQDLSQDGIPMDGISLAGHVVLVRPLNLTNAKMTHADFSDGEFDGVNFTTADLAMSKWDNTTSISCNFRGASFWAVTFNNSTFTLCDFGYTGEGKTQRPSDFIMQFAGNRSQFNLCNFAGTESPLGIWNSVSFEWCNFAFAHLWQVVIGTNVNFEFCNLYGATTASPDFIKWAYHQRVVFTNVVTLEGWHYCLTNRPLAYKAGGPEFMEWASNQFNLYINTNNPQAWINWSRENLQK